MELLKLLVGYELCRLVVGGGVVKLLEKELKRLFMLVVDEGRVGICCVMFVLLF